VGPASDVVESAGKWDAAGKNALALWKNLVEHDFAAVNLQLQKAHFKPLVVK
jgi:hypothetical protein